MKNDINILYVAPRYHTNQVPIMKGWHDSGAKVSFFVAYQGHVESHEYVNLYQMKPSFMIRLYWMYIDKHYDAVKGPYTKGKSFIPSFGYVYSNIKKISPDIVVLRNYSVGNFLIVFACRLLGIKNIVMYVQEPLYGNPIKENTLKGFVKRHLFPNAIFTPVLYNGKNRTKERLSGRADIYVPLIGDKIEEQNRRYCPDGVIRVLYVGKYRPYKKHHLVINALSKVNNKYSFHLTIIGQLSNDVEQKYYDELCDTVKHKNLEDVIDLRADVGYNEMKDIYAHHDMLILASKEMASIAVVEAMANGLCVIGSIYNGTSSYLEEYECGKTFDPSDEDGLVNLLDDFSVDMRSVEVLGKKAKNAVQEHLSFEEYKSRLLKLIDEKY